MRLMLSFLPKLAVTNLTGLLECGKEIAFQSSRLCLPFLQPFSGNLVLKKKDLALKYVNHTIKKPLTALFLPFLQAFQVHPFSFFDSSPSSLLFFPSQSMT